MLMDLDISREEIEKILEDLKEENKKIPIIVEGKRDVFALQFLGCMGNIITVNKGVSLTDFCDMIASEFDSVVLLTDWDRRGGILCRRLMKLFKGRLSFNITYRQKLAKYAMVRKVESLPSWLDSMKSRKDTTQSGK